MMCPLCNDTGFRRYAGEVCPCQCLNPTTENDMDKIIALGIVSWLKLEEQLKIKQYQKEKYDRIIRCHQNNNT